MILSPSFLEVILISSDINFLFIYILFLSELSKSVGILINLVNIFPLLLIIVVPGIFIFLFIYLFILVQISLRKFHKLQRDAEIFMLNDLGGPERF